MGRTKRAAVEAKKTERRTRCLVWNMKGRKTVRRVNLETNLVATGVGAVNGLRPRFLSAEQSKGLTKTMSHFTGTLLRWTWEHDSVLNE